MAGLWGYAAAGALAGAGEGIATKAERNFAAMQEELRNSRQVARDEAGRAHQTSEREATQTFRAGETAADRDWRSGEAEENRAFRTGEAAADRQFRRREGETDRQFRDRMAREDRDWRSGEADREAGRQTDRFQDSDGNWWVRSRDGAEAERVTGPDGKPIAGAAPRDPNAMTKSQRSIAISRARKEATSDDPVTGEPRVDYRAFIDNLGMYGVDPDETILRTVRTGLREQIASEVAAEAETRKGEDNLIMPDVPAEYDGKAREVWERDETARRVDATLVDMGLQSPSAAQPTSRNASVPAATNGGARSSEAEIPRTPENIAETVRQAREMIRRFPGMRDEIERRLQERDIDPALLSGN